MGIGNRTNRQPGESGDLLTRIGRERLALGENVVVIAEIPHEAMFWQISHPFESVCQQGHRGIVHRSSLHSPTIVTRHYFVEREALLGSANKQVPPSFGECDHDSRLADKPRSGGCIPHNAKTVSYRPIEVGKLPGKQKTKITKFEARRERKLLLTFLVLRKGHEVHQE